MKGKKKPDCRMVQWRYADGGEWTDVVQDDIGVSAGTWWWTEIPLDVSGKDADLTQSDRQVELEFRTIGWDEQAGPVLSHTVEWQLTEVGESHQQLNPETDELESVDAHLIQMGEKMILHVPYPEDVPAGCATKVWVEEDTSVQSVYTSETVEDASSGLPNGVFTFANESPNYAVKGEVASTETMLQEGQQTGAEWEQDPNYGLMGAKPLNDRHRPVAASTEVYVIKKLGIKCLVSWHTNEFPSDLQSIGDFVAGWLWTSWSGGIVSNDYLLQEVPDYDQWSKWAHYESVGGKKAFNIPECLNDTVLGYLNCLWWSRRLNPGSNALPVRVEYEGIYLSHDCEECKNVNLRLKLQKLLKAERDFHDFAYEAYGDTSEQLKRDLAPLLRKGEVQNLLANKLGVPQQDIDTIDKVFERIQGNKTLETLSAVKSALTAYKGPNNTDHDHISKTLDALDAMQDAWVFLKAWGGDKEACKEAFDIGVDKVLDSLGKRMVAKAGGHGSKAGMRVGLFFLVTRYQIKAGIAGARALDRIVVNRNPDVIREVDSAFVDYKVQLALQTLYVPFIVEGYHYYTYQSPKPMVAWAEKEGKAVRGLYTGRFICILTHEEIKSLIEDHKIGDKPPSNWIDEFIKCADQLNKGSSPKK